MVYIKLIELDYVCSARHVTALVATATTTKH